MVARHSPLSLGVLAFVALLGAACSDSGPIAPPPPDGALSASLELSGSDEPPDSGEVVVYPYDGPGWIDHEAKASGAAAVGGGPTIRIGVVQTADTIRLGSPTGEYTIRDKADGVVLMTGSVGATPAIVTLASVPVSAFRLQVMCASASAVSARKAAAEALGHVTFTEFVPAANCTRLYIGELPSNSTAQQRTAFRNLVISQGLAATDSFYRLMIIRADTVYRVARSTLTVTSVNPVIVTSPTGRVTINGATYRERGEAHVNASARLAGINELPLEQYLYGVVPRELGPIAFPQLEAQKAQAIAARTFAVAGFGRRAADGYDLRATTDDQVYGGYVAEHPLSSAAVDATAGLVATYEGRPISALYHSTSGGHTANNEEAFSSAPVAYLRGVADSPGGRLLERLGAMELSTAYPTTTSLREVKDSDFDDFTWSRFHRWTFEWTMAEMTRVISDFALRDVGAVKAINVLQRGPSGRVLQIAYVTEKAGTVTATKDGQIRSSLRFFNAQGVPSNLLSTLFVIEPIHAPGTNVLVGYRAYGGGFGHGVGMSQTGAVALAERGVTHGLILRHYYRGIALTPWY